MIISVSGSSACKQVQEPLVSFQKGFTNMLYNRNNNNKDKVVVILGATGTGKTKLAIDLANHFPPAEIVNSDKMQVYKGLDITTNKVTPQEARGVPHHLLGTIHPNANFTAHDFCRQATSAVDSIVARDALPIIAGGSNSYLDALINHHSTFRLRYECCFLWVDVSIPILHASLRSRVDRMIEAGQVEEVRKFFEPLADYERGIRRAIGVPEFNEFLRAEALGADEETKKMLLDIAIARIKVNNCTLANRQIHKIQRLHNTWKRTMHRLDATQVFLNRNSSDHHQSQNSWEEHVLAKSLRILHNFLYEDNNKHLLVPSGINVSSSSPPVAMAAVAAAATH
ncbi:hypothetical protein HN51_003724 [Arachis hypogaea]|uniref:adenylate dimethylallyltransferase (ADP/ATP-dependent) n=2 Tax=Arachis TaxID=3817 RepID=A0A445DJU4_ARAHY|nr:adenylate isopentenyltransferase 5, chloroplastic [Arachis duranensis]XP_025693814.1 adenylate isopentenyltransferase 5, chloroplastic [Arachis hypogaea]QHO37248.1 Adenylate isopentenyltransferase 5 [Arachis hypogaea]QHO37249.1 Adenylate isopentenyltransferase 5 [Arachis hypogaea]QHO37250.1 Adenylate isopentenyltransferase 5 [Arachis hypogaea]RYR63487.1 hypothetical protein Ahy_A04g021300 [Arachis hypogaea]